MKRKITLIVILILATCLASVRTNAQTVSSVDYCVENNKVKVTYKLDSKANIELFVSINGGSYIGPLKQVMGDVGKNVTPGYKKIIWDAFAERPELKGDEDVQFSVRPSAPRSRGRVTFFTLNAAHSSEPQWSFGFTFGQVRKVGWFIGGMSNFNFDEPDTECGDNGFINGTLPEYVNTKSSRNSVLGGLMVRFGTGVFMKLGAGYGFRTKMWVTDTGVKVKYPKDSYEGVEATAGLLFNMGGFVLSVDAVTNRFKTLEVKLGIGLGVRKK